MFYINEAGVGAGAALGNCSTEHCGALVQKLISPVGMSVGFLK